MARLLRRLFQQQSFGGISATLSRLASTQAGAELSVTLKKTDSLVQPLQKKSGRPRF